MTQRQQQALNPDRDSNRDPITGAPGSHPVGTGVGAVAGGMAAGAAAGTVAGPVGTAIGAAVGAIAGGLAGHGIAELVDPTAEEAYWRENYSSRPYVAGDSFDEFGPAYRYGVSSYSKYPDRTFYDLEAELSRDWDAARGTGRFGPRREIACSEAPANVPAGAILGVGVHLDARRSTHSGRAARCGLN